MSILFGIEFLPEPSGTSKIRDSTFDGDASSGEGNRLFGVDDVLSGSLNELLVHGFLLWNGYYQEGDEVSIILSKKFIFIALVSIS